jgi:hypothetical protein
MTIFNPFKKKRTKVGWVMSHQEKGGVIWYPPEAIEPSNINPEFENSVIGRDLNNSLARYFLMRCPYDLKITVEQDPKTKRWFAVSHSGNNFAVAPHVVNQIAMVSGRHQWRHPDRPLLQIFTPYRFYSDEHVYISQLPPFPFFLKDQWPGAFVSGRFPIDVWPRIFMWAIEVHDRSRPLILRRGDPWFIARFESSDPSEVIDVVEAQTTREIEEYFTQVDGITTYVNQTFSVFKEAWKRRPKKLLIEKNR